ncbi:MAG: response regulator [bacterium]
MSAGNPDSGPSEKLNPELQVLLAENVPHVRHSVDRILGSFQLRNISHSTDGYKAVEDCRSNRYGLVLISSSLSKMDGIKVLSSLRESGRNRETPVILLYNPGEENVAEDAAAAGASGSVEKPVDADILKALVEQVLDRHIETKGEAKERSEGYESATESLVSRGKRYLTEGNFDEAEAVFEEAMVTGGGSEDVFSGLAEVYLAKGNTEAAEQVLVESERLDSEARQKFKVHAPKFVRRGDANFKDGRLEEAKNNFQGAVVADKENVAGHVGLGESLHALGDKEGGDNAFARALEIDKRPEDLHVYNRIGIHARREKEFDKAVEAYDKALSFDSEDPVLYYNKSLVLWPRKNSKRAWTS